MLCIAKEKRPAACGNVWSCKRQGSLPMRAESNKGGQAVAGHGAHRTVLQIPTWTPACLPCALGLRAETSPAGWERSPVLLGTSAWNLLVKASSYKNPLGLSSPTPSFPRASCWGPERKRNLYTVTRNVSDAGSSCWVQLRMLNPDKGPWFPKGSS